MATSARLKVGQPYRPMKSITAPQTSAIDEIAESAAEDQPQRGPVPVGHEEHRHGHAGADDGDERDDDPGGAGKAAERDAGVVVELDADAGEHVVRKRRLPRGARSTC